MIPMTSSPWVTILPRSSQITRLQVCSISSRLWATRKTVPASLRSSSIRARLFTRNSASPVASASSTSSTSWLFEAAIANRSREPMPDE